ncbi:hypothetical protein HMPREF1860_00405 [Prevotella amnii]|uniref:FeoB-associated Cys-rich membrane protein n=1 Tax=Prevotella amnii TaxID=419005 RepID=A0A134BJI5_9BACT|nr:hypothetical protein HMPREF1860_00405 [Prevotella amnii]
MWQYFIISIVLFIAICYACKQIIEAIRAAKDPCGGCKGCAIRKKIREHQKTVKHSKQSCHNKS